MRSSRRKIVPSPKCGPGSNIPWRYHQAGVRLCQGALSRAEEDHPSHARELRWSTCSWLASICCAGRRRSMSAPGLQTAHTPNAPPKRRIILPGTMAGHGNRHAPHPSLSRLVKRSLIEGATCQRRAVSYIIAVDDVGFVGAYRPAVDEHAEAIADNNGIAKKQPATADTNSGAVHQRA
jgi:hypothetical protein